MKVRVNFHGYIKRGPPIFKTKKHRLSHEDSPSRGATAIHYVLEYLAKECRVLGLRRTEETLSRAACEVLKEYEELEKKKSPAKNEREPIHKEIAPSRIHKGLN